MATNLKTRDIVILIAFGLFFGFGYLYTKYIETDQIKGDFSITEGMIDELANEYPQDRDMKTLQQSCPRMEN